MSPRTGLPASRQATIALCLLLVGTAMAVAFTATADAARYRAMICAAATGSQGPTLGATPGFFDFGDNCGTAYGDPANSGGYLRLEDNTAGVASHGDEASYSWRAPDDTAIAAVDLYTRQPLQFHDGWRTRVWTEDFSGNWHNILIQGSGVQNSGLNASATTHWAPHPWPFAGYGDYKRLYIALRCYRPAGCDRSGRNVSDANSILLTLEDKREPEVDFRDTALSRGDWVRGEGAVSWREADRGSGLRYARLRIDGGPLTDAVVSHGCDVRRSDASGEFASKLRPCSRGPFDRYYGLNTEDLADGTHEMSICAQDFSQHQHVQGSPSETCDTATIRTDNTAPGQPAALEIDSANPARYLDRFGATFSLPPDPGSPIAAVHYQVRSAAGEVVSATKTLRGHDPTEIEAIQAPAKPGAYRLRVWLTDSVGLSGPAAEVAIPRDTTPPAAPQQLRVLGPDSRWAERVSVVWRNLVDDGAPIDTAYLRFLDRDGDPVGSTRTISADNPESIADLSTPARRGRYEVQVWLADGEGNVGAAASAPLPIDTEPPAAPQRLNVASPDASRTRQGFDVSWRNLSDSGSPIVAAHYRVSSGGEVVVPTQTVSGRDIDSIERLRAPDRRGSHTLEVWLSDAEGNVGAPVRAPLAYDCVRSPVTGGKRLSAALGGSQTLTVEQGHGAALSGRLTGEGGIADAPVCVFSQTEGERREFLGVAVTDARGAYRFALARGPNRTFSVVYRPGQRRIRADAQLRTRVHPTLRARRQVVYTGEYAYLEGEIPGPRNDEVVVVIQVREGSGWLAFRRYSTRGGGKFAVKYPFRRTSRPTTYEMRAQVRETGGYPYLQGNSDVLRLRVLPKSAKPKAAARRCPRGSRWVKRPRRGAPRCAARISVHKRCARARRVARRHRAAAPLRRRAHRLCARSKRLRVAKRRAARRAARVKAARK